MRLLTESPRPILLTLFVLALASAVAIENHAFAEPDPAKHDARDVAQEILKIQQELGGSVVKLPAEVSGTSSSALVQGPAANADSSGTKEPVLALRQAGLQLDLLAHRLELIDLYSQADAVRELAQRMRQDARDLKQAETAAKPD